MEFLLLEKKFKFVDDVLYSFCKKGKYSKTEKKWYLVKLSFNKSGYKVFSFKVKGKTKLFRFRRVVYYANNPQWDIYDSSMNNFIDHIDGIKTNNHISNLRNVTNQENQWNRTKAKGYCFDKVSGKYKAQIRLNRKQINIGCYDTPEEAHQAYLNKKAEIHIIIQR